MGASISKSISASEREADIRKVLKEYIEYLSTTGGVVLTAEYRLQVARWTVDALDSSEDASLPQTVCLKPGSDVYETVKGLHNKNFNDKHVVVRHLVHSLVNHQFRLDKAWYETTLKELDREFLGESNEEDSLKHKYLLYSLFAEIVAVISCVQCVHMTRLIFGDKTLDIPAKASANASPPSWLNWSEIITKSAHDDDKTWLPYVTSSDIEPNHPSFQNYFASPEAKKAFLNAMTPMAPFGAMNWSIQDMQWILRLDDELYLPQALFFSPYLPSLPNRCAISRRDLETMAAAISNTYECAY